MEAMIKLYVGYIEDVIKKKHLMPEVKAKRKKKTAAATLADPAAAPGVAPATAPSDAGASPRLRHADVSEDTNDDEWVPSPLMKEDKARVTGNLDMNLTTQHLATKNGKLKVNQHMSTQEVIQLFALNPDSRFRFCDVVQDVLQDKIYYRPTSSIIKKVRMPKKRNADDLEDEPIRFCAGVVKDRVKKARESTDVEAKNEELKYIEMLLEHKALKGVKEFKLRKNTPETLSVFLQDIQPAGDLKMPATDVREEI